MPRPPLLHRILVPVAGAALVAAPLLGVAVAVGATGPVSLPSTAEMVPQTCTEAEYEAGIARSCLLTMESGTFTATWWIDEEGEHHLIRSGER